MLLCDLSTPVKNLQPLGMGEAENENEVLSAEICHQAEDGNSFSVRLPSMKARSDLEFNYTAYLFLRLPTLFLNQEIWGGPSEAEFLLVFDHPDGDHKNVYVR